MSDHLAISLQLDCNIESANKVTHEFIASPRWGQLHVDCYKQQLDVYLSNEVVPADLITCTDVNCINSTCVETIHALHNSFTYACQKATSMAIPHTGIVDSSSKRTCVPGWSPEHSLAIDQSLFWHKLWITNDKPDSEWVAENMQHTRSRYNYMVRSLKRSRDFQISGALGRALISHRNRDYWREARKIREENKSNAAVVNGYTESKDIANKFANKYSLLYNFSKVIPTSYTH